MHTYIIYIYIYIYISAATLNVPGGAEPNGTSSFGVAAAAVIINTFIYYDY